MTNTTEIYRKKVAQPDPGARLARRLRAVSPLVWPCQPARRLETPGVRRGGRGLEGMAAHRKTQGAARLSKAEPADLLGHLRLTALTGSPRKPGLQAGEGCQYGQREIVEAQGRAACGASRLTAVLGMRVDWIVAISGMVFTCQRTMRMPAEARALSFFASAAWRSSL